MVGVLALTMCGAAFVIESMPLNAGSVCKFTLYAANDWREEALSFVFVDFGA